MRGYITLKTNKKILMIDLGKEYGGAEKMLQNLISQIESTNIYLAINEKSDFNKLYKGNVNKILCGTSVIRYFLSFIKLVKIISDENIDIVHAHGISSCILAVLIKKILRVRLIVTVHSDILYDFCGIKLTIYKFIERIIFNTTDKIVTVSQNLKFKLINRYKLREDEIDVIYNGIELSSRASEFKIKDNKKIKFIFVGRLERVKNLDLLLDGVNYLKDNGYKFSLDILGDGKEREYVEREIKRKGLEGIVKMLGFVEDSSYYMNRSNVLVMTSYMEGIPMVIIEAFSNKLTVVSSNVGGVPEMIENNVNGIMFDINDKQSFFNVLVDIVEGNYDLKRIGNNAYIDYLNKWSNKVMTNAYLKLYE